MVMKKSNRYLRPYMKAYQFLLNKIRDAFLLRKIGDPSYNNRNKKRKKRKKIKLLLMMFY